MTDEELKQKCTERARIFQQAMESCYSSNPIDCIEWFADRIAELEAKIEKMKCCCNCDFIFRDGNCYYDKECKNKDHWKLRR